MKHPFYSCMAVCLLLIAQSSPIKAQSPLLAAIEKNNLQLQSYRSQLQAQVADAKADNTLGATSVEYSPFYAGGVSGIASSELIVSQEMDFPTLYASRRKAIARQQEVQDLQYRILRRDILLDAHKQCIDLIACHQAQKLLMERLCVADTLLGIYKMRLENGDATILDVNRIRMDRMELETEVLQSRAESTRILLSLKGLNGGVEADTTWLASAAFPTVSDVNTAWEPVPTTERLEQTMVSAAIQQSQQELKVSQQGWMPKLTLGYRRNTEMKDPLNGFLVGAAFPLFSTPGKVKAARMRQSASELQAREAAIEAEASYTGWQDEAAQLRKMVSAYDVQLMQETLSLLQHAVLAGQLSVIEYYTESDRIHQQLQQRISLQCRLAKVMADLTRDTL